MKWKAVLLADDEQAESYVREVRCGCPLIICQRET